MLDEIHAKRDEIYAIARRHKAEKLWVFGSCARKEERPDSDVDMERFIVLMNREPRDYTKWGETRFNEDGESIYELAEKIKAYTPHRRRCPVKA